MSKAIERRLAAAERRLTPVRAELEIIRVLGGFDGGSPTVASVADVQLVRGTTESYAAFSARVEAAATASGETIVVIAGLP
jgi:hypothetical protein